MRTRPTLVKQILKACEKIIPIQALFSDAGIFFVALSLLMLFVEYFGWQGPFHRLFAENAWYLSLSTNDKIFFAQLWTTLSFFFYLVFVPFLLHRFVFRNPVWLMGKPEMGVGKIYFLLYALMLPLLISVASASSFYNFYPLYRPQTMFDWLRFEAVYLPQFFTTEFFFRGPNLAFADRLLGDRKGYGVFVMVLPYALIHTHKPFAEALGSIVAGFILGHLALKGKSLWPGFILHMLIALSMDFLGLYNTGFFS